MGLTDIVGDEGLVTTAENAEEYSSRLNLDTRRVPGCVVRPADCTELQAVVKWANNERVPLVAASSGPPHCRGGASPGVDGAVIVDMRRMNRILRVDPSNRVAVVEPGVTFGQLQLELAKSGLCAYMPLLPRSKKSVLASVLDRDPIVMPSAHFDATDPMLCAEVVLGSGDKMRTGEAAGPDSLEEQWEIGKAQISPFGPTQMDMQRLLSGAQGTIGIVSWMSLKCRFLSELTRSFLIPGSSLEPLIDLSYQLTRIRFSGNLFIVNGLNLSALLRRNSREISALRAELPVWVLFVSCEGYGPLPREKVEYLEADLGALVESRGLELRTELPGASADELSRLLALPSPDPYWKLRFKGGSADIFFLTTQGKTPKFTDLMYEQAVKQGFPAEEVGVYIQPVVQGTSCHCEFNLFYDPADQASSDKARNLAGKAADELEAQGAFFSRPYGVWADIAYRRSSDTAEMQRSIKEIFDPNGILNPGKLCF